MNIYRIKTLAAVAAMGISGSLPSAPAFAQSGSRICGYTAATSTGYLGLLLEARNGDKDYDKQCDDALSSTWSTIQKDPQLKQLKWTRRIKNACEEVGSMFVSSKTKSDICEPMNQKQLYRVTKTTASDSTTFEKI